MFDALQSRSIVGRSARRLLVLALLAASALFFSTSAAADGIAASSQLAQSGAAAIRDGAAILDRAVPNAAAPVLVGAKLRRNHGTIPAPFDLPLSLDPTVPTIEPRTGLLATFIFTFDKPVVNGSFAVIEGVATLSAWEFTGGNDVIVQLIGVTDMQYVAVELDNVEALDGGTGGTGTARVGFLSGDVNQNGVISLADLGLVNAQLAQPVTAANYLKDVNASGTLTVADKAIVNSKLTQALPPASCTNPTGPGTLHSTLVPGDHWTVAGNPHIITFDVALLSGTLTIDPCVVVRVREGFNIRIGNLPGGAAASIIAKGLSFAPIIFESDDPTKRWGSLRIFPTGTASLESVTLLRAGNAATAQSLGGALQVLGDNTTLSRSTHVKNVIINSSATFGLNVQQYGGLTADSSGLSISNSGFQPGTGVVDARYAIYVTPPSVQTLFPGQYTGNALDAVLVDASGAIATDEAFHNLGIPYRMRFGYGQGPTLSEAAGGLVTLTIDPGVTIKFLNASSNVYSFRLGGSNGNLPANIFPLRLLANGTAAQPIVFTSAADTPAPGDWGGIAWRGGPATGNVINHVRVEYAGADSGTSGFGCGPGDNDAALIFTNWIPAENFVQNSTFSNSAAGGIVMGWISDLALDFKTSNTFTGIANACAVARWKNKTPPACPSPPPVCF